MNASNETNNQEIKADNVISAIYMYTNGCSFYAFYSFTFHITTYHYVIRSEKIKIFQTAINIIEEASLCIRLEGFLETCLFGIPGRSTKPREGIIFLERLEACSAASQVK